MGLVSPRIIAERTGRFADRLRREPHGLLYRRLLPARISKRPEEIRKANLRGADLRGANIEGVDFYLVDLRGAKYDPSQAEHFRSCGAILEDRCPQ